MRTHVSSAPCPFNVQILCFLTLDQGVIISALIGLSENYTTNNSQTQVNYPPSTNWQREPVKWLLKHSLTTTCKIKVSPLSKKKKKYSDFTNNLPISIGLLTLTNHIVESKKNCIRNPSGQWLVNAIGSIKYSPIRSRCRNLPIDTWHRCDANNTI